MKASTIKNILQNVIYFLEYDKYFDLCNDPNNDLESFLIELNRYRAMAKLDPIVLEQTIPTSTGGQKCRFAVEKVKTKVKEAEIVIEVEAVETLEPTIIDKVCFKKITRTAFVECLKNHFNSEAVAVARKDDDIPVTNYFIDNILVGSWAKAAGWHSQY